jgi:ABC-type glycerol-3-phosphate transport system substrate-binding protein
LQLETPQSWEEVEAVLKSFVANDPDGKNNVGLTLNGADDLGTFDQILTTFTGVHSTGWTKQNGRWSHKVLMPEFKEGVKFLHRMYEEGVIDKEFGILKASNAREKFTTGRAGMIIHNANGIDYQDFIRIPLQQYKSDADVTLAVPFPSGPKGQVRNSGNPYGSTGIFLAHEDEEASVRMMAILNWLLTEEGTNLSLNGVEGIHYELQDGKIVYNEAKWQQDFGGIEHHFIRHLIFPGIAKEKSPRTLPVLRDNYMDVSRHGVREEIIGLNTDNTDKYGAKREEAYTKWISNFVTGDADIGIDWDKFIEEWTSYGYEAIVDDIEAFEAANNAK